VPQIRKRRAVYLLERTRGPQGRRLGKTSGWVHRASLKAKGVRQLSGVNYERIDDGGLHISFGPEHSGRRLLEVDNVVICAALATELDAERAIRQGTELAAKL
jgi:2,4-dienoyl-CoA reductase (NADPH2)